MKPEVPESLKTEHKNLKTELNNLIEGNGKVSQKAQILAKLLNPHFDKEEESVLPHLGLLLILVEGRWDVISEEIFLTADKLQKEFYELLEEHKQILKAAKDLETISEGENNSCGKKFAKDITLHAQIEEQVLYPAVMLIDKYLKTFKQKK